MRQIVRTDRAPAAIGPYSQAVKIGGFIFISGQIPIDPASGEVVQGDIAVQTERVLQNLRSILDDSGMTLRDVAKTTVFLTNMDDFASMNEVYARFFPSEPPARSAVQVVRLPKNVNIEIEAIAWMGE